MARSGSFQGPSYVVGQPVDLAKPPDNKFPQYDALLQSATDLTDAEKQTVQQQVDQLYASLILARDYVSHG